MEKRVISTQVMEEDIKNEKDARDNKQSHMNK